MVFSIESQLSLLGSQVFEELCALLVKKQISRSEAFHLDGKGGDKGVDIFSGLLKPREVRTAERLDVWQVKYFVGRLTHSRRAKIRSSLDRVMEAYYPDSWTLCLPLNLTGAETEWYQDLISDIGHDWPDVSLRPVWTASHIVSLCTAATDLLRAYFIWNRRTDEDDTLDQLLHQIEGFDSVESLLGASDTVDSPDEFYQGTAPTWANVVANHDCRRQVITSIWSYVRSRLLQPAGGRVPLALLVGNSMDGKTTLLMRLGAELSTAGVATFFHKPDHQLLADQLIQREPGSSVVLLIDHFAEKDPFEIRVFLERLQRSANRVVIVAAVLRPLWSLEGKALGSLADIRQFDLSEINDDDMFALAEKIGFSRMADFGPSGSVLEEDLLDSRLRKLRLRSQGQMGVVLAELQTGVRYSSYVASELERIEHRHGAGARRLLAVVAAFHRTDTGLPLRLLERISSAEDLEEDLGRILREEHGVCRKAKERIVTRHPYWAECLLECLCPSEFEVILLYRMILRYVAVDGFEDAVFARALRIISRRSGVNLVLEVLGKGEEIQSSRLAGLLGETLRRVGKLGEARRAYRRALELAPREPSLLMSCARLEEELRNWGEREAPYTARWYYDRCSDLESDPNPAYAWCAWAALEAKLGNLGYQDASQPYTARWMYRRASELDPANAATWIAWALLEEEQGNIGNLFDKPRRDKDRNTTRWLLRKGTQGRVAHPSIWRAWAMLETRLDNVGSTLFDDLYSARWIYFNLLRLDPSDSAAWRSWAIIEKKEGNIGSNVEEAFTARWMFRRATDENPEDSHSWQAWGMLELERGNTGTLGHPEKFSARWLFLRSIEVDRTNSYAWSAWARLEREERNVFAAEGLFAQAAEVETKGDSKAVNYCQAAEIARQRKDMIALRAYCELAVAADSKCGYAWYLLGFVLRRWGAWAEAENSFRQAAELAPNQVLKSRNFFQASDMASACGSSVRQKELLGWALEADPTNRMVRDRLAELGSVG